MMGLPSGPSTALSPEVSAAAHHLWHTRNVLLLPSQPPLLWDGHQDLLWGRGSHCRNAQGIMTDPHTCDRQCWIEPRSLPDPPWALPRLARAVPGQSTVVNPDPARSNRQGDQFNQFSTTATHPHSCTWHWDQDPKCWAGPACPCAARNPSTGQGDHPNSITEGPPAPARQPHPSPISSRITAAMGTKLPPATAGRAHRTWLRGGQPSSHPTCSSLEMLPLIQRHSQSQSRLCLAQAHSQLCLGAETSPGGIGPGLAAPAELQTQQEVVWEVTPQSLHSFSRAGFIPVAGSCARCRCLVLQGSHTASSCLLLLTQLSTCLQGQIAGTAAWRSSVSTEHLRAGRFQQPSRANLS